MAPGDVGLIFAGEERRFALRIGELRRIEEKTGTPLPQVLAAMHPLVVGLRSGMNFSQLLANGLMGAWRLDFYREVILQGLIGGGMSPTEAGALVTHYVDPFSPLESLPIAYEVLLAWFAKMQEVPAEEPGERKPARARRARKAAPTSPDTTQPAA